MTGKDSTQAMTQTFKLPPTLDNNRRLERWVRVNADGTVTVRSGKVEIGQGIVSAMAQVAAEELCRLHAHPHAAGRYHPESR